MNATLSMTKAQIPSHLLKFFKPRHTYKHKDEAGIPAAFAAAARDDGWTVRSQIAWCKAAPMPESVTDRPTNAVEYIYLLTKRERYFYDADAVRQEHKPHQPDIRSMLSTPAHSSLQLSGRGGVYHEAGRNLWNYWILGPEPNDAEYCTGCSTYFDGPDKKRIRVVREGDTTTRICPNCGRSDKFLSHFAMFPTEIPRRCIRASTSQKGVCGECGAPWKRVTQDGKEYAAYKAALRATKDYDPAAPRTLKGRARPGAVISSNLMPGYDHRSDAQRTQTLDWQPTCAHDAPCVPATVLDPFSGAGTTCLVADQLGRSAVGVELNPDYAEMSRQRIRGSAPMLAALEAAQSAAQPVDMFALLDGAVDAVAG